MLSTMKQLTHLSMGSSNEKLRSLWNKIKSDYDHAMVNFTKSGNHSSSFTAAAMRLIKHQEAQQSTASGTTSMPSSSSTVKEDGELNYMEDNPEGIGEGGFANFTWSLVVVYLRQWLNEKPQQTNFCSRQLPIEAQSDSLVPASVSGAASAASSKKKKLSKINGKELMMDLERLQRHDEIKPCRVLHLVCPHLLQPRK
jgi:hypothetical protein